MLHEPQKTLVSVVCSLVNEWRRREGWSRETVVDQIVAVHVRINGPAVTGIEFSTHPDTCTRMKVNAEKMYRWLDDFTKDCTLLPTNFIPTILAALPDDLKLQFMNALANPIGYEVRSSDDQAAPVFNPSASASTIVKESAAAVGKLLSVSADPSQAEIEQACKELDDVTEAVCAVKRSLRSTTVH